jgi:hypothetical protein
LVEVYDLGDGANSKLANISTCGFVHTGDNVMIGGLIVGGGSGGATRVIVRALGSSVPVVGALADPTLDLHDGSGALIASNDNWKTRPDEAASKQKSRRRLSNLATIWNQHSCERFRRATTPLLFAGRTARWA